MELVYLRIKDRSNFISMRPQEVSRVHSTSAFCRRKGRIQSTRKLHPQYVAGFIYGEGSFWVGIYRDETMRNNIFVRAQFEIEVRADDREILERIQETIGCGKIYGCYYECYGWYPHVKYKISRFEDLHKKFIPFLENGHYRPRKRRRLSISGR